MTTIFLITPIDEAGGRLSWGPLALAVQRARIAAQRTGRTHTIHQQTSTPPGTIGFRFDRPLANVDRFGRISICRRRGITPISDRPAWGVNPTILSVDDETGFRYRASPPLGDTLTSWACESESFVQGWRNRVNQSISSGTQAAVVSAAAAGFLGAMIDRPLLGAAVGAAVGWATHAIWTAPQAV